MPPPAAEALLAQAAALIQGGQLGAAARLCQELQRAHPHRPETHYFSGLVALQQGQPVPARQALLLATRAQPKHALAWLCLGVAHQQLGALPAARQAFERALQQDPQLDEAWSNLAAVHLLQNDTAGAEALYRRALTVRPQSAAAHAGLAALALHQGRPAAALASAVTALGHEPRHPGASLTRAQALFQMNRTVEAREAFDRHLEAHPRDWTAHSQRLLVLHYEDSWTPDALAAEHRHVGRALAQQAPARPLRFPERGPRLRLGIVSPDFRQHSIAAFLPPLLAALPRERFTLVLYHDSPRHDATTERYRQLAQLWRPIAGCADEAVAAQIRKDQIDVLLDVAGHTGHNRMGLFAQRLAPVQVTYLGYPNTTGLPTMDVRFTDDTADPPGLTEAWHTEKLVRFSSCAWCYEPPDHAPLPVAQLPETPTFGSFNALNKLSPFTLRLWARLLSLMPESRLLLKSTGLDPQAARARLQEAGLPLDRVELMPAVTDPAAHLGLYQQISVALDPFPYHGTTTTCEALWMGVPVVTLAGQHHVSRVGASLLRAAGHPEWVTATEEDFLHCAQTLARSPATLLDLRQHLRPRLLDSVLLDHAGQGQRFAHALEALRPLAAPVG